MESSSSVSVSMAQAAGGDGDGPKPKPKENEEVVTQAKTGEGMEVSNEEGGGDNDKVMLLLPYLVSSGGEDGIAEEEQRVVLRQLQALFLDCSEEGIAARRLLIDGDGAGDDRKLMILNKNYIKLWLEAKERVDEDEIRYRIFRSIMLQTKALSSAVRKTVDAIIINEKANIYWESIHNRIRKDIRELKVLVTAHSQKVAEIELRQKQDLERKAVMRMLEQGVDRDTLAKEVARLEQELVGLKAREEELKDEVAQRRHVLNYMCDLSKRLTEDDLGILTQAIAETEEKQVLSDVSMDLE